MEHSFTLTEDNRHPNYKMFGQGDYNCTKNYRVVNLCLGLLTAVLFITAVVLGVNCTKIKENSLQVSHSATSELISELSFLRSNHSDVIEAKEEVKRALDMALKKHVQLKKQIKQLETINNGYQGQLKALRAEKTSLQSNISALDASCGRCPSGWILFNSSCYFFSYSESSTKKNWNASRADCVSRGSDLVVIDNQQEQIFVSKTIKSIMQSTGMSIWGNGFWLGLIDMHEEGTWRWINNVTEVESRYWGDGEPNNYEHRGEGEDCAVTVYGPDDPWKTRYDDDCQIRHLNWICEVMSN